MKTIGLIGGVSWESTSEYYRLFNEGARDRLGGDHSARLAMYSLDFDPIAKDQHAGNWDAVTSTLVDAARRVEAAGAELLLIGANTLHLSAKEVADAVDIPLVHIAQATGSRIAADGLKKVGLLGTRFTMEGDFISGPLAESFGLESIVPDEPGRAEVHRIIYDELVKGVIDDASRQNMLQIIAELKNRGAQGVVLGCTELSLIVDPDDSPLPAYDTVACHVSAALDLALG